MQQNVQSERPIQNTNYSHERNSLPSKIPDSQIVKVYTQPQQQQQNNEKLQTQNVHNSVKDEKIQKMKQIEEEIQKEKQLIEKLKKQNQLHKEQIQNNLHKSFLSLNPNELETPANQTVLINQDELLQTKTQADLSLLENRKHHATQELQSEEEKYRQNIRKIQQKKSQTKKKLRQDPQIPIKIMDFDQLQKKKSSGKQQIQVKKSIRNQSQENQSNKKSSQKDENINNQIIETESKKQTESNANEKSQIQHQEKHETLEKKIEQIQNKSLRVNQEQGIENKSKVSAKSSHKKYSVKISSIIVPEINQSMKQIQQRREKKNSQIASSAKKQSQSERSKKSSIKNDEIKQEQDIKVGSEQQSPIKVCLNDQQVSVNHKQKQLKSQKQSIKSKTFKAPSEVQSQVARSQAKEQIKLIQQSRSVKDKSSKSRSSSKKEQKIQLMYIPHAPKQPSHKSFKKTDKSIQWSQVDISMYGKTNDPNSHNNSGIIPNISGVLQHESVLNELKDENMFKKSNQQVQQQLEANKINMKKNNQAFFEQFAEKEKTSEKSKNLAPLINKDKFQKQSQHSRSSYNKQSIAASRQGSVKQKSQRYDQFHRQHSLNSRKVENKKIQILEANIIPSSGKPASYRSRKSNPISNSSVSKSKAQTVSKNGKKSQKVQQSSIKNDQSEMQMQESRLLISKQEINFLHSQIKQLEEKLNKIQQKQQLLAKEKAGQLQKLDNLMAEQNHKIEESLNIDLVIKDHKVEKAQNQEETFQKLSIKDHQESAVNNVQVVQTVQIVAEEKPAQNQSSEQPNQIRNQQHQVQKDLQGVPEKNVTQNQPINTDIQQTNALQKSHINQQLSKIAQIEAKFTHQKEELLEQISKLKKTIRDLQIQKIKSIDHEKTINASDNKSKRPQTQNNEYGIIIHQNRKNQTLDPIQNDQKSIIRVQDDEKGPFGKIVRNSPEKNSSKILDSIDTKNKSVEKKFRINISKKPSILSEDKHFESAELPASSRKILANDDQGNDLLERKRKQAYPINAKQGYVVVSNESLSEQKIQQQPEVRREIQQEQNTSKVRKSQIAKQEILERFHRTNRQFNNFIESSRVINETNSSLSSQQDFFFNKTGQSFTKNKVQEEYNPENTKILNKLSSSNLQELHKDNSKQDIRQSFTRIINDIKNDEENDDQDEEVPEIQVRDVQMPQLAKNPDISFDQEQLMQLAIQTFKLFDIQVTRQDTDFNMKKYKNCVIFTKGTETILWHYNGKFYIGGWKGKDDGSGQKTGYGIEIVPQKHIYKGQFMNGKKHGTGIMKSTNGNIYDGQWIEGIKNGQGTYYDSTTKVVYQGQWKQGKKNGFGILKFSEKQYYKGTFIKSVKDGYGLEVFVNGDKYKGQYRKGKFHGKGKYSWSNGSVFEGNFFEGMRHGHGTWKSALKNGDIYVGSYNNDKKSGYGRYVWSNGCIYEGNFAQDVKHGKGRLIYTDGKQIKGVWQQGSLLEAVTQNPKQHMQQDVLKKSTKLVLSGGKAR